MSPAAMSETYSIPNLAPTVGTLLLLYITIFTFIVPALSEKNKFWKSQPWAGKSNQWFASLRAQITTIKDTRSLLVEGYEKYGKHNKVFILPQLLSEPVAIIPSSFMHEITSMPDSRIDLDIPIEAALSADRLIGPGIGNGQSVHFGIVRRQLTRRLPSFTSDIYEELVEAMKEQLPAGETWSSVKVYPVMMKIISQAANRLFCGTEVCRNPVFIENSCKYSLAVFTLGGAMKMVPKFLHPIVHNIFKGMISKPFNECKKIAIPVIRHRLRHMQDPELSKSYRAPYDALQWLLEELVVQSKTDPSALNEDTIALRLLNLNMASIHSTSITTTNAILDLYSSPNADKFIAGLREECERVLEANGGVWTKDAVNALIRVDSTIRESMRMSALLEVVTTRMVADPKGVDLSDGTHIPHGVLIAFSQNLLHEDPSHYPENPNEFNAFRFSAPRENYLAQASESKDPMKLTKALEAKNEALIAVGPDFLGFGAGRHACPGRFFASQEMKLALAHMLLTYDIKIEGGRPPNSAINGFATPSEDAEIHIRLRQ